MNLQSELQDRLNRHFDSTGIPEGYESRPMGFQTSVNGELDIEACFAVITHKVGIVKHVEITDIQTRHQQAEGKTIISIWVDAYQYETTSDGGTFNRPHIDDDGREFRTLDAVQAYMARGTGKIYVQEAIVNNRPLLRLVKDMFPERKELIVVDGMGDHVISYDENSVFYRMYHDGSCELDGIDTSFSKRSPRLSGAAKDESPIK